MYVCACRCTSVTAPWCPCTHCCCLAAAPSLLTWTTAALSSRWLKGGSGSGRRRTRFVGLCPASHALQHLASKIIYVFFSSPVTFKSAKVSLWFSLAFVSPSVNMGTFCNQKLEWLQMCVHAHTLGQFLGIIIYWGHCDLLSLVYGPKFTFPL